nr:hypothetical protein TIFTF001_053800 [Ficus carica]GMN74154.1 hypothetical protein TIFTF001_053802 [Ficus carica]
METAGLVVLVVLPWRWQVWWRPLHFLWSWQVECLAMALVVSAEPASLAACIATEAAGFVAVLTADANNLFGEPGPIRLSSCGALVGNVVSLHERHVEWKSYPITIFDFSKFLDLFQALNFHFY